jgi:hypothetical protein
VATAIVDRALADNKMSEVSPLIFFMGRQDSTPNYVSLMRTLGERMPAAAVRSMISATGRGNLLVDGLRVRYEVEREEGRADGI